MSNIIVEEPNVLKVRKNLITLININEFENIKNMKMVLFYILVLVNYFSKC